MRIVYISNSTFPSITANSIHVMKMCNAFAEHGHEILLISPHNRLLEVETNSDIYTYYGVKKSFVLKRCTFPIINKGKMIYSAMAAMVARLKRPDIVYGRNFLGCIFSVLLKMPTIYEAHAPLGSSVFKLKKMLFRSMVKQGSFVGLVVITHSLKKEYEKNFPEIAEKIWVFPDGADPISDVKSNIQLLNSSTSESQFNIGYVGSLYKGKGMELISELANLCPAADFHVVGGASEDLEYWKSECSNIENLYFYGYVPHSKTSEFIQSFDLLLLPNKSIVSSSKNGHNNESVDIGKWTSPLKMFEYMSSGVPIVASNLPVLKEVLRDRVNSLLCDPDDSQAWFSAITYLQENRDVGQSIANVAKEEFKQKYTWKARAENIIKTLN